jgi:uncharacterized protein (UPF0264 family)
MSELNRFRNNLGLLVSVRDAAEADVALEGGADVIDIKEPSRGSLGAADADVVAAVAAAVSGRLPISVAAGELLDWRLKASPDFVEAVARSAKFIKFGLSGCAEFGDWPARWQKALAALPGRVEPVAVAYADWQTARAPTPVQVMTYAVATGCRTLLVDTWDKSGGDLFEHWPAARLAEFGRQVRGVGVHLVLAGSLRTATLPAAVRCQPTLIAVRGAVCDGDRSGRISLARVRDVRASLVAASLCSLPAFTPASAVTHSCH